MVGNQDGSTRMLFTDGIALFAKLTLGGKGTSKKDKALSRSLCKSSFMLKLGKTSLLQRNDMSKERTYPHTCKWRSPTVLCDLA